MYSFLTFENDIKMGEQKERREEREKKKRHWDSENMKGSIDP